MTYLEKIKELSKPIKGQGSSLVPPSEKIKMDEIIEEVSNNRELKSKRRLFIGLFIIMTIYSILFTVTHYNIDPQSYNFSFTIFLIPILGIGSLIYNVKYRKYKKFLKGHGITKVPY